MVDMNEGHDLLKAHHKLFVVTSASVMDVMLICMILLCISFERMINLFSISPYMIPPSFSLSN